MTWKGGSSQWVNLNDIKDAYPIEVAENTITNKIASEPAFNWWAQDVLRKKKSNYI